jgi:hypothetical protein
MAGEDDMQARNAQVQQQYHGKLVILDKSKQQLVPRDVDASKIVLESNLKDTRVCPPGARMTRDYQVGRLNLIVDADGLIQRAYYG